jgi:hypothetical protein
MQLPEKYKENCDVSGKGPSSGVSSGGAWGKLHRLIFHPARFPLFL